MKIGVLKTFNPDLIYDPSSFTKPVYVFTEEELDEDYNDITSIENIMKLCTGDFRKKVWYCGNYLSEIGFENLNDNEKRLACELFLVEKSIIQQYLTSDEIASYWRSFNDEFKSSRIARWKEAFNVVALSIPDAYGIDLAFSVDALSLNKNYIEYNIATKASNGVISGLFDYLEGKFDFVDNGFPSKPYWTQDLQDKLMDILKHGNY